MRNILYLSILLSVLVFLPSYGQTMRDESDRRAAASTYAKSIGTRQTEDTKKPETVGAVPKVTQAESVRAAEEALQMQLLRIAEALDTLETRITDMRRQADAPPRWDIERADENVKLLGEAISKIDALTLSPLAEIQRNDLRDRLFEAELSIEISKRRWGGNYTVFGMDFFANAPTVPTVDQRPAPANYRIRTGDKLRVSVVSNMGREDEYHPVVDTSGSVYVPGAGNVLAAGKTQTQLNEALTRKISARFPQLRVSLAVETMTTMIVQVVGDVARPNTYTMTGLASVMGALYQAGGPTKSGTFRKIVLVRDGESKRNIDLYDVLMNGNKTQDLPLKDGDMVFVPPVGATITVEGDVVRPARYEPSFPITLSAALKMAGGVKPTGYLQTVQVERVEKSEYRILVNEPVGDNGSQSSFQLKPGDQITVTTVKPDRTNQVSISGPVRAAGVFGFADGMKVSDLVKLAQGLDPTKEIYGSRADILRANALSGNEIVTVNLDRALKGDPEQNIALRKLDRLFIYEPDQVVFRPRLVTISGSVAKPGTYKRTDGMRVSDAIAAAGGILPEAFLDRVNILRHAQDGTTELIKVSLQDALSGDTAANVKISDRDELTVYDYKQVTWSDHTVRIEGAVQRPGVYSRSKGMRVTDIVFACGGLLPESAKTLEVARRADKGGSELFSVDIATLTPGSEHDLILNDRDIVTVPAVNPSLRSPEIVILNGEVMHPGPYAIHNRNERLVDVIARAGGLTPTADARGMLFLRQKESFENAQQSRDADMILAKSRVFSDKQLITQLAKMGVGVPGEYVQELQKAAEKLAKPSEVVADDKLLKDASVFGAAGGDTVTMNGQSNSSVTAPATKGAPILPDLGEEETVSAMGAAVSETNTAGLSGFEGRQELAAIAKSSRISVDLNKAFRDPQSADNIPLRQGDHIYIPRMTNVVTVIGAVLHPHDFAADSGKNVDYYIRRSGGFAQDAAKGNVVVIRSNGDALPKDRVRTVEPGDAIVVPTTGLIDIAKKWERMGSVTKVISDVLSSAFVITRF